MLPLHLEKQYFKIIVLHVRRELQLLGHSQTSREDPTFEGAHALEVWFLLQEGRPALHYIAAGLRHHLGIRKEEGMEFKPAPRHSSKPESPISACKQKPWQSSTARSSWRFIHKILKKKNKTTRRSLAGSAADGTSGGTGLAEGEAADARG